MGRGNSRDKGPEKRENIVHARPWRDEAGPEGGHPEDRNSFEIWKVSVPCYFPDYPGPSRP